MAILDALKKKDEEKNPSADGSAPETKAKKETKDAKATSDKKESPKKKESAESKGDSEAAVAGGHIHMDSVLKHPHITEKAAIQAEKGVYTFLVHPDANKVEIARAVKAIYDVEPVRVHIIHLPAKKIMSRGRRGMKAAKKKALVYLKKGDKIEFV